MREVDRELRGAMKRSEREHDAQAWHTWHVVALDRTKKLPKLEKLLCSNRRSSQPQTPEEHELALKAIFLAFGGDPKDLRTLQ